MFLARVTGSVVGSLVDVAAVNREPPAGCPLPPVRSQAVTTTSAIRPNVPISRLMCRLALVVFEPDVLMSADSALPRDLPMMFSFADVAFGAHVCMRASAGGGFSQV